MYAFSVSAKTSKAIEGFNKDDVVPFIVYINFKDLFGAEKLCQLYVLQQDFYDVVIEKRKLIEDQFLTNKKLINADKALKDAIESGYAIQIFNSH